MHPSIAFKGAFLIKSDINPTSSMEEHLSLLAETRKRVKHLSTHQRADYFSYKEEGVKGESPVRYFGIVTDEDAAPFIALETTRAAGKDNQPELVEEMIHIIGDYLEENNLEAPSELQELLIKLSKDPTQLRLHEIYGQLSKLAYYKAKQAKESLFIIG